MQKKKVLNILRYLVFFAPTVVLMYFAFRNIEPQKLWDGIKSANLFWIVVAIAVSILAYIFRAARWQIIIEPLGHKPTFANTYNATMIGYLTNLALPRVGEITRCGVLANTEKLPFDKLIGTVVVERIFDLIILLLAVLSAVLIRVDVFGNFLFEKVWQPVNNGLNSMLGHTTLLLIILLSVIVAVVLIYFFRDKLKNIGAVKKVKSLGKGFAEGIKSGIRMKHRWMFLLYSLLITLCYWMMSYTIMLAIPETAGLTIIDALFLYVLGGLGWVVPAQGGFGSFHLIVAMGLGLYGIAFEQGIVFATISHESQVLFMLILGFISLACVSYKLRKKKPIVFT
ncbi:MAG: flippase-like domain-containing protein [Prevotellaceae bacterium]|nr:flippase-like domain-containing protein [Prevotellaceae bacterium]